MDRQDLEVLMSHWGQEVDDPTLIGHWKLDETEGIIAHDSAGHCDGTVCGDPTWLPDDGVFGGALALAGSGDFVATDSVLDPSEGPFSVLTWIKGGAPGQAIISQVDGEDWLVVDAVTGTLATGLIPPAGRTPVPPLVSDAAITDDNWHRIGFVWDGVSRALYVDDVIVTEDAQDSLAGCAGAMNLGCDKDMTPGTFWEGLIDDVQIYNRAVRP